MATRDTTDPGTPGTLDGVPGCFAHLSPAGLTDIGKRRSNNEDALAMFPGHGAFFVADGMGGAADGEVAAQAAMDALAEAFNGFSPARPLSLAAKRAWVAEAANRASKWIFERSKTRGKTGMGTTLAGVCMDPAHPGGAVALHAGDSRVYRVSGTSITRVTRDHSFANEVGVEEESMLNPEFRNVILRALGMGPGVELEATPFQFAAGDFILVCSDGLTRMVDDAAIASLIKPGDDAGRAARALVARALENGGKDNVTVVLVKADGMPAPCPAAECEDTLPPPPVAAPAATGTAETPGTGETLSADAAAPTPAAPRAGRPGRALFAWMLAAVLAAAAGVCAHLACFQKGAETAAPGPGAPRVLHVAGAAAAPAPDAFEQEGALRAARREGFKRRLLGLIANNDAAMAREAAALLPEGRDVQTITAMFTGEPRETEEETAALAEYFAKNFMGHIDRAKLAGIRAGDPVLWERLERVWAREWPEKEPPDFIGILCDVWNRLPPRADDKRTGE